MLPWTTGIDATMLTRASKLVSAATSFPVQYNKAIVGRNAFAHESGIHQDGMLKHTQTYEIMTPESVGVAKTSLVMGKHSGRAAFRSKLKELGYDLGDNALEDAFNRFKALADRKKVIYDEDIEALVDEEIATFADRIKVVVADGRSPARRARRSATLTLDIDGKEKTVQSTGNGPVDAIFNAIQKLVPAHRDARALPGPRRHRRHRRAGRGVGAPAGGRPRRSPPRPPIPTRSSPRPRPTSARSTS